MTNHFLINFVLKAAYVLFLNLMKLVLKREDFFMNTGIILTCHVLRCQQLTSVPPE